MDTNTTSYDFENDYANRINPELTTFLLQEAVPVIKDIDFHYLEVRTGYCKSILPLNEKSSNQHGTHQALLLAMCGDYTGGLAFASLIYDEPIMGIHEITSEKGMSLWLTGTEMKYFIPSTDDIIIEAVINDVNQNELNQKYHAGKSIFFDVNVSFRLTNGIKAAEGIFKFYCRKKKLLTNNKPGSKINIMFEHILKTSARLIAQLRAMEGEKASPLFTDNFSGLAAGKQGRIIAKRFIKILPELQNMVAARTFHLDSCLNKYCNNYSQVLFIGVGLDFRKYRIPEAFAGKTIFELDLPEMLEERICIEKQIQVNYPWQINQVSCNLTENGFTEKLLAEGFNPAENTFFIYEGCSMYFSKEENTKILSAISTLMGKAAASLLWADFIDSSALDPNQHNKDVISFLRNISKLGEPFQYGIDNSNELLHGCRLSVDECKKSSYMKPDMNNEIYDFYNFFLLHSIPLTNTEQENLAVSGFTHLK